jgi:hypothetical protein
MSKIRSSTKMMITSIFICLQRGLIYDYAVTFCLQLLY